MKKFLFLLAVLAIAACLAAFGPGVCWTKVRSVASDASAFFASVSVFLSALAWWEIVSLAVLFTVWTAACIRQIPEYTGAIVVRFGKPVRSRGPGLSFVFWPIEWIGEAVSLKEQNLDGKMTAEAKNEDAVPLDYSIEYRPIAHNLVQFLSFEQSKLADAIKQRVKSLLSIEVGKRKDWDDVLEHIKDIAEAVQRGFNSSYGNQYAVHLRFMVDDPELSPELAKAADLKKAQEKENERRGIEQKKMMALARSMIKEEERHGRKISLQEAMDHLKVQFKIVTKQQNESTNKNTNEAGLNGATLGAIKDIATTVIPMFIGKSKRQGGKRGRP